MSFDTIVLSGFVTPAVRYLMEAWDRTVEKRAILYEYSWEKYAQSFLLVTLVH